MNIQQLTAIDPVAIVEDLAGTSSHVLDDKAMLLMLALQAQKSQMLRQALVDNGDFLFSDTWPRRQSLLLGRGWTPAGSITVEKHPLRIEEEKLQSFKHDTIQASLHVWSHPDGLIFVQDTHTVRQENGEPYMYMGHGHVYFVWKANPGANCNVNYSGGFFSPTEKDWDYGNLPADVVLIGNVATCDGLFWVVDELKKTGTLQTSWPKEAFRRENRMFRHEVEIDLASSDWSKAGQEIFHQKMVARLHQLDAQTRAIANA